MKKTGVLRLLVAVLDVNSIPDDADIVVDDCLYEIFFKVDRVVTNSDPESDEPPKEKDHKMEGAHTHEKSNVDGGASASEPTADPKMDEVPKQMQHNRPPSATEMQVLEQPIDFAVDTILEELSTKVAA